MISILMPVYNAAPFLEDCLDSIICQSYPDWELIAVDDFSKDGSKDLLNKYAQEEPRITVLENKKKGVIPALQLAYSRSQGSHITRMDADDIMPQHKLASLLKSCRPGAVVTGKVEYFRSDGELGGGFIRYADWLNGLIDSESHWDEIYKECVIPSPAWMMERLTFDSIGAFDSDSYPEDYELVFRMYAHKLQVIGLDELVHQWRDHGERASRIDPNYADNRFLDLKLNQFLLIDLDNKRPLALWGAGKKGKFCAQFLIDRGIHFSWHTDNSKKQGKDIYGLVLQNPTEILANAQCLLTMAAPDDQVEVVNWLEGRQDILSYWLA